MGDVNETKGELAVNYRIGVPLSQQLDTDLVQQMRTLTGARYNPVDRNNTIVMQYKKTEDKIEMVNDEISSIVIYNDNHEVRLYDNEKLMMKVFLFKSANKPVILNDIKVTRIGKNDDISCKYDPQGYYLCDPVAKRWGMTRFRVVNVKNVKSDKVKFYYDHITWGNVDYWPDVKAWAVNLESKQSPKFQTGYGYDDPLEPAGFMAKDGKVKIYSYSPADEIRAVSLSQAKVSVSKAGELVADFTELPYYEEAHLLVKYLMQDVEVKESRCYIMKNKDTGCKIF